MEFACRKKFPDFDLKTQWLTSHNLSGQVSTSHRVMFYRLLCGFFQSNLIRSSQLRNIRFLRKLLADIKNECSRKPWVTNNLSFVNLSTRQDTRSRSLLGAQLHKKFWSTFHGSEFFNTSSILDFSSRSRCHSVKFFPVSFLWQIVQW